VIGASASPGVLDEPPFSTTRFLHSLKAPASAWIAASQKLWTVFLYAAWARTARNSVRGLCYAIKRKKHKLAQLQLRLRACRGFHAKTGDARKSKQVGEST
jgi:hypothetical protein